MLVEHTNFFSLRPTPHLDTAQRVRGGERGGTEWHGHTAMRISVSSWATTDDDVERSVQAMIRIAKSLKAA